MPYLKSAPSNYCNCKIFEETKMSKFGTKNALFGYFWPKNVLFGYFEPNIPYLDIFGQDV